MVDIPTIVTAAGLQPTPPATLQLLLIGGVQATNPDYTANLPGILIEDISSTDVGALVLIDQAKVETVNSLTPYGANDWLLIQLGNMAGIEQADATNTSIFVVFTGTPGFTIVDGFVVSDGTYQYVVQDGGIIGVGGSTVPLFCIATQEGSWAVPSGTVTQLVTAVPALITLSVDNPSVGTPGGAAQSAASFRQAVLQAQLASAQGMTTLLKTLLAQVPNIPANLVSVAQSTKGWEVIAGGGDPYFTAYAIFLALFDINALVGSSLNILSFAGNPCVVTLDKFHQYATEQIVEFQGIVGTGSLESLNDTPFNITVISPTSFSIPLATPGGVYSGGGVCTPNFRNITAGVNDYPNTYQVTYVNPPILPVGIVVTWNDISTTLVSPTAIAQLAGPPLVDYVNGLTVGQPLNALEMEAIFVEAVAGILPAGLISKLTFTVSINGIGVAAAGVLYYAEPNSSVQECGFNTDISQVTFVQG